MRDIGKYLVTRATLVCDYNKKLFFSSKKQSVNETTKTKYEHTFFFTDSTHHHDWRFHHV